jgi:hypothetical protein
MERQGSSGKPLSIIVSLGFLSAVFFLVFSLSINFLILPGLSPAAGTIPLWIISVAAGLIVCYIAAGIFLNKAPAVLFADPEAKKLSETFRDLPKLVLTLGIFTFAFAVISGLVSVLVFYVFAAGSPEPDRRFPVMISVYIIIILSLPFFIKAFTGFAAGDTSFGSLLKSSIGMGAPLYLKFLVIGAVAFFLSFLIRFTPIDTLGAAGDIIVFVLTSIVLGMGTAAAWTVYKRDIEQKDTERRAAK